MLVPGGTTQPRADGTMVVMAMTARVKDELSRLTVTKPCCRKAEVSAILRFAGGLHIIGGKIVVEAELDTAAAARRLRRDLTDMYGHRSELVVLSAGGLRRGTRYVVRVEEDGESLARHENAEPIRPEPSHRRISRRADGFVRVEEFCNVTSSDNGA